MRPQRAWYPPPCWGRGLELTVFGLWAERGRGRRLPQPQGGEGREGGAHRPFSARMELSLESLTWR